MPIGQTVQTKDIRGRAGTGIVERQFQIVAHRLHLDRRAADDRPGDVREAFLVKVKILRPIPCRLQPFGRSMDAELEKGGIPGLQYPVTLRARYGRNGQGGDQKRQDHRHDHSLSAFRCMDNGKYNAPH